MIKLGNKSIQDIRLGNKRVYRIYLGGPNNLLKNTQERTLTANSNAYNFLTYQFDTPMAVNVGDKLTVSVDEIEVLAGNPTQFTVYLYNDGGEGPYAAMVNLSNSQKTATMTITRATTARTMLIYAGVAGQAANNSIRVKKVMLVKGDTPAPRWTPAPSEATVDSCVIWKEEQPYNLLTNSDFKNYASGWTLDANVTIDATKELDGRYSVKSSQSGLASNGYRGAKQNVAISAGQAITLSGHVMTDDISALSADVIPIYLEVIFFNASGGRISQQYINAVPKANNQWEFFYGSFIAPANTAYVTIVAMVTKNGCAWFNGLKAELGKNEYPEWTPAASETENLLRGTAEMDSTYWSPNYVGAWTKTDEYYKGARVWSKIIVTTLNPWMGWFYKPAFEITEKCTLSFYAKVSAGTAEARFLIQSGPSAGHTYQNNPITTEWKRFYIYLEPGDILNSGISKNGIVEFLNYTDINSVTYIAGFKLERGRNPNSAWTPNKLDTENLLLNSDRVLTGSTYKLGEYALSEKPIVGETYTITIWGDLSPTKHYFGIWNSGGIVGLVWAINKIAEGVYSASFEWKNQQGTTTANDTSIWVYHLYDSDSGTSTIHKIKLERGRNPNPAWTPPPPSN